MRNRIFVFIILLCTGVLAEAEFPKLEAKDLPGSVLTREQTFNGESLWGYIDGGADLYLEYGFTSLLVQELDLNQIHFTINIYRMRDSASAFGIFSISRYKCSKVDSISEFSCISNFQFQVVKGKYYFQIINNKGNTVAKDESKKIASILLTKTTDKDIVIPAIFRDELVAGESEQLKYINGILGLQNGYPDWIDRFSDTSGFSLYLLPVEVEGKSLIISLIKFSGEDQLKEFFKQSKIDYSIKDKFKQYRVEDKTIAIVKYGNSILFLEGDSSLKKIAAYVELIKVSVQ